MDELSPLRERIDEIDDEVLRLLNERARVVLEVGKVKHAKNATLHVPEREKAILERLKKRNPGPFPNKAVTAVFREIISHCLNMEGPIRVAYLGPEATFSHQAAHHFFGTGCAFLPQPSLPDVVAAVEKGDAAYGVVPVENSTEGSVAVILDGVADSELAVCGEVIEPIHHCLLAKDIPLSKVKHVFSHPQPLAQCRGWLRAHLPDVRITETTSTAIAARDAARESGAAAIAAELAAETYGLDVLKKNIEDVASNRTRFWVVARESRPPSGDDKTSVLISVKDEAGSLYTMLEPFGKHGIGLTRIESRPSRQQPWEYLFFIDLLGHAEDEKVAAAIKEIRAKALSIRVLGSYPRASEHD